MSTLRDESVERPPGPGVGRGSSDPTGDHDSQRLEAFSDGVIAIAITLLVLELKVPHDVSRPLAPQLLEEWPSYSAYLVSFATIGIMWLNHHRLFTLVRRVDQALLVWNGLLLLGISIVPFPTALVAARLGHEGERLATGVYTGLFVYLALVFNGLWRYASSPRRDPQLLHLDPGHHRVLAIHDQYRVGPLLYVAAFALSFWIPAAALLVTGALAVFFLIPPRAAARDAS